MAKKGKGKGKSKGFFGAIGSFLGSIPIVAKAKKAGKALWKEAKKKKNQLKKFLKRAKKKLGKFFTKARKKGRKLKKWAVRWVKHTGKAAVLWVKNTAKKAKQAYQQTKKVYTQAKQAVKDIKAAAKEAVKVYKSIDKMEPQKTTKDMSNKEKLEVMAKNFLLQQVQSNKGKLDATIDVGKSTIQDIKRLVTGEALDDLAYAVSHPVQTAKSMGKAIKDSYEKDVLNGNAYSKSYWLTDAKLTVATSLIGTKGIGSVAKVGKLPDAPKANVPKVTPNTAVNLKSDVLSKVEEVKQQLRQLRTPSYELAGVNVGRITDNGTVGKNTPPSNPKPSTSSKPPQNSSNSKPVEATKGTGKNGSPKIESMDPSKIRFSQTSVNGSEEIINSMKANGWKGDPIDVVKMPDRNYTTIDNTRVAAAREAGINVQTIIRDFNEPLPANMIDRFTTKKGVPETWGEALELRVQKQKASFRNDNPMGSYELEKMK